MRIFLGGFEIAFGACHVYGWYSCMHVLNPKKTSRDGLVFWRMYCLDCNFYSRVLWVLGVGLLAANIFNSKLASGSASNSVRPLMGDWSSVKNLFLWPFSLGWLDLLILMWMWHGWEDFQVLSLKSSNFLLRFGTSQLRLQESGCPKVPGFVTSDGDDSQAAGRTDGSEVGRGAGRAGSQAGRSANTGICKESGPVWIRIVRLLGVDLGLNTFFFASGFGKAE